MFIKKSTDFDMDLVRDFQKNLEEKLNSTDKDDLAKVVESLNSVCNTLEQKPELSKVYDKVIEAIEDLSVILEKPSIDEDPELASYEAEKDVQEDIEEIEEEEAEKEEIEESNDDDDTNDDNDDDDDDELGVDVD